ncbi:MFS transporter [Paraflavitalea speifideaquila]|uniref:MFS transporter n=1 Tax=Paraflavitalea speifideaquila TaxID=3076558 RepID=UPI003CCD7E3A
MAHFKAEEYAQADTVFGKYIEKYPEQSFGYYWRARANSLKDSAMEKGLAIPHYHALAGVLEKDSASATATTKKWLVEAYGYIAAYETNQEKDYADAIEHLQKILEIDPANKDAQQYISILEKKSVPITTAITINKKYHPTIRRPAFLTVDFLLDRRENSFSWLFYSRFLPALPAARQGSPQPLVLHVQVGYIVYLRGFIKQNLPMAGDPESVSPVRARIAIAVFFFVSGFGFATWASRIPTIQQKLHLNEAQLGAVLFAMPAGLMLTLPLTGFLLRRFSSRYIMLAGALLFNIMMCLVGFVDQTWQLVVVLFCFGSARNLFNISANAQSIGVQALFSRSIIASLHGIWSTAGFAAAAIGTLMVSAHIATSWHFGVVSILLTSLCCYFFKDSVHQMPSPHERKGSFVWPNRTMLKFGLVAFASMACEGTMYDWAAIYLRKATGAPDGIATAGYAIYMVAMTLGRFTGDWMANRIGIKKYAQIQWHTDGQWAVAGRTGTRYLCGRFWIYDGRIWCILRGTHDL